MSTKYTEYYNQAGRLYEAIVKKSSLKKVDYTPDELWKAAFNVRNAGGMSDYVFDYIANLTYDLDDDNLELSDEELLNRRNKLGELILDFEAGNISVDTEETKLGTLIGQLSMRSREAVVDADSFSELKQYMHVKRDIQDTLDSALKQLFTKPKGVVFLVGNVGDGKSHLLGYMKDKYKKEFFDAQIDIINDATESDRPNQTAIETLLRKLRPFSDAMMMRESRRLVIAINLGVITNLLAELRKVGGFNRLVDYLVHSGIITGEVQEYTDEIFTNVSFFTQKTFEIENGRTKSKFFEEMFNRVFSDSQDNPFYEAYLEDVKQHRERPLHTNFALMLDERIKNSVIYLLIRAQIEYKQIISARVLMNFMYDIVFSNREKKTYDSYLPFLIFDNTAASPLLETISKMDPTSNQTKEIDELSVDLFHAPNVLEIIEQRLGKENYDNFKLIFDYFRNKEEVSRYFPILVNSLLRVQFLLDPRNSMLDNQAYKEYVLTIQEVRDNGRSGSLFELVNRSLDYWNGNIGKEEYVVKMRSKDSTTVAVKLDLEPVSMRAHGAEIILTIENDNAVSGKEISNIEIDYRTFELLQRVVKGYVLKKEDRQTAIKFDEFVSSVTRNAKATKTNLLYSPKVGKTFELKNSYDKVVLKEITE
jgi:DNA phosphorothioation-dependent restriction protein DptF